uniref:F-box domain-containing protein n=1 Tax=Caenorhabditis tropicalis TaxID=1561998 RepID=A0A1I7TJ18_9PELO
MPFQLFSLPQSVYTKIINSMSPCELFFTSLCSQNAYSIIKTRRRKMKHSGLFTKGNFEFQVDLYDKYLKFRQSSEIPIRNLKGMVINGNTIRYELVDDKVMTTYWTEPIVGTMTLIEYTSDLFNVTVEQMDIYCDSGESLMLWVQQRQPRLEKVEFYSNKSRMNRFTPETLTSLIAVCEAESIVLNAHTTKPLQPFHKKCNYFASSSGTRITLKQLMMLDCVGIMVDERNNFTSGEINRFFKHWMSGGSPRLTLLKVYLNDFNDRKLMAGIDGKWNENETHVRTHKKGLTHPFYDFFEIQGATNGMSAGFQFEKGALYFGVWPSRTFPLFRLPHLASMEIINAMNTTEQFLTSLCSRRAFSIIKSLRRRSKNITMKARNRTIIIADGDEQLTCYQNATEDHRKEEVTVNGHPTFLSYNKKKSAINTFWAEPVVGTKELIEHLSNLFGIHVDTVMIDNGSGIEFMNWVQRRQGSSKKVIVTLNDTIEHKFEPEDLKNIIMSCEAENIQIEALHSTPFEIQDLHKRFKEFKCLRGTWVTLNNLMTLDCIQITVKEKQFTCTEMNRFIKHWLNGGSPRLSILRVPVTERNESLFEGIDAHLNMEKVIIANGQRYNGFFEVFRRDGRNAVFRFFRNSFWFGVWPIEN